MRVALTFILFVIPFFASGQYGFRKTVDTVVQKDLSGFKPHSAKEIIVDLGFGTNSRGIGLIYNSRVEYFITDKFSGRFNFFINSLKSNPEPLSYTQVSVDGAYHFFQEKRWDVYSYLGIGFHRLRNVSVLGGHTNNIIPTINSGIGGRYRVTPSFGLQLEFGRTSTFGLYKSLDFLKGL